MFDNGVPTDAYRAIIDDAQKEHPDTVFYFQHGGYLQRRFLYGLHCPPNKNLPCINVHTVEGGPFEKVLLMSKLLVSIFLNSFSFCFWIQHAFV